MLFYVELNSKIRLRVDFSSQIRPDPALAGFGNRVHPYIFPTSIQDMKTVHLYHQIIISATVLWTCWTINVQICVA